MIPKHNRMLLTVARLRRKMRAERIVAVEKLEAWFRGELDEIRKEMAADRAELRQARAELARAQQIREARAIERNDGAPLH
jgi:hypothetical protein